VTAQQSEFEIAQWRDKKRYLWLMGLIAPTALFVMLPLVWAFNQWGWHAAAQAPFWIGPILLYILLPALDLRFGPDGQNPPDEAMERLENDKYYRYCTYIYIPFQYASVIFGAYLFTASDLSWLGFDGGLGWPAKIGLALSVGVLGGVGINTAHEMGHKKDELERWLSKVTLAQTCYGHFYIEHNRGHHVRVATPEDPASSRLGESFWEFLPRTVSGSLTSAWHLEAARLERLGKSPWTLRNDILGAWAMTVVLFAALAVAFGPIVLPYLVLQAIIGFSLLEVVNYLEHYGLLRDRKDDGRYQRCLPKHSWNSNNVASNVLLYHLQRHSDHHANPTRRYQALRHVDEAPQLPTGYAGMIVLAWFPPIWRRVMDPRLLDHFEGDVTQANIQPRKRAKILKRYGGGGSAPTGGTAAAGAAS
jgi:alkane 1-monooxygenase